MTEENEAGQAKEPTRMKFGKKLLIAGVESSTVLGSNIGLNLQRYIFDFVLTPANYAIYGTAQIVYAIVNSFNDPLLGSIYDKSDRKKRFKRFYWMAVPLFIVGMAFQILPAPGWQNWMVFLAIFLGFSLFDTGFASVSIAGSSLIYTEEREDHRRGIYSGIKLALKIIPGLVGSIILNYYVTDEGTTYEQMRTVFLIMGGIFLVVYLLLTVLLKPPKKQKEPTEIHFWRSLGRMLKMPSFLLYIIATFLIVSLNYLPWTYLYSGITELGAGMSALIGVASFPLSIVMTILVAPMIKKMGLKKTFFFTMIFTAVGYILVFLNVHPYASMVGAGLSGLGIAMYWPMNFVFTGRIMDEYERRYSEEVKGTIMGINAVLQSPASSVMIAIFGLFLANSGYDPALKGIGQAEGTILILRIALGLLPALMLVAAMITMLFHPYFKKKE